MTDFLVKHFVKNYDQVDEIQVRTQYGTLASICYCLQPSCSSECW